MRLRFVLVSVAVPILIIALAIVGGLWTGGEVAADPRASLTAALDSLPADTQVAGFTDWAGVRKTLDVRSTRTASTRAKLQNEASLSDLSTRSVIGQFIEEMHDEYGWSAADLEWEAYGQAQDGVAMVGRLDDSVSFDSVRSHLRKLGYSCDGQVWTIRDPDTSRVSAELTGTLAGITLFPRQRLVVAADRTAYAMTVRDTIDHDAPSLLAVRAVADVAATLVGADSALLQTGSFACQSTSLAKLGADVQAQARAAIDRAGSLVSPEFAGRALDGGTKSGNTMRFALGFRSPSLAARQLQVRRALASGPFIGRSGLVEDSLVLRASTVRGSTALLRFRHDPDTAAYMVGDGPLLFAGCPQ